MPQQLRKALRADRYGRRTFYYGVNVDLLYRAIYRNMRSLVKALMQRQPDDVGAGQLIIMSQSVPAAALWMCWMLCIRMLEAAYTMSVDQNYPQRMISSSKAFKDFGLSSAPTNTKTDMLFQYWLTSLMPLSQSTATVSLDLVHFPDLNEKDKGKAKEAIARIFTDRARLIAASGAYARWTQIGHSVFHGVMNDVPEIENGNGLWMLGMLIKDECSIITTGIDSSGLTDGELIFRALNSMFMNAMGIVFAPPWVMLPNRNLGTHPHSVVLPDYVIAELTSLNWLDPDMGMYSMAPTATIWPPVPGFDTDLDMNLEFMEDEPYDYRKAFDDMFDAEYKLGVKKRPKPGDGEDPDSEKFKVKKRFIKDGVIYVYDVAENDDDDQQEINRTITIAAATPDEHANILAFFELFMALVRQRMP